MDESFVVVDVLKKVASYLDVHTFFYLKHTCTVMKEALVIGFIQNASIRTNKVVYDVIHKRKNVFITGPAGCGKTYTLQKIMEKGKETDLKIEVTSTTGISASYFDGGNTLHSFARLGLAKMSKQHIQDLYDDMGKIKGGKKHWINTNILIIDEVSMLGLRFFEKINLCAQLARNNKKPFGGLQVVLCGDFLQLPPVMDSHVFMSPEWNKIKMKVYHMTEPVRQNSDTRFFHLLNRIRRGETTDRDIDILRSRIEDKHTLIPDEDGFVSPILYPTNRLVNVTNKSNFSDIHTEIKDEVYSVDALVRRIYDANIKRYVYVPYNNMSMSDAYKKMAMAYKCKYPKKIKFKEGAQYFLTCNIDVKEKLVNGSLCLYKSGKLLFKNNKELIISKNNHIFRQSSHIGFTSALIPVDGDVFMKRLQLPLKLGYAVTIHSSQGMTLDEARIDIGKHIFTASQTYVALSRIRDLEGVSLSSFDPKKIRASAKALEYYKTLI